MSKTITRISYSDDNEKKRKGLTKKIDKETKQNENEFTYLNSRIRKICEKARQNIEMSSLSTSFENNNFCNTRFWDKKTSYYYSESYFLQKMCNEIDFFKEDAEQIGRTFGPYTFRGWSKRELKNGIFFFTKPKDNDIYFVTKNKCLAIYNETEYKFIYVPRKTPNINNGHFIVSSLTLLYSHLRNMGRVSVGDSFGYLTVGFCGRKNSYYVYREKNNIKSGLPYQVDILYNDCVINQVCSIIIWGCDGNIFEKHHDLQIDTKNPLLVFKGIDVYNKEELFGNVYFNKETNKYEIFDGYFWQEVDVNELKTDKWGQFELNNLHRNNCNSEIWQNQDFKNYKYANMFNYEDNKSQTTFKENCVYLLKRETLDGSEQNESSYLLVKYIHDIFGIVLDCLVVKQLTGNVGKIFTLTKSDCALLEIEYQRGLQILPSQLNWEQQVKENDDSTKDSECG